MKVFWGFLTLDMPSRAAFTMFSMREKYQRMEGVSFSIFAVFSHGRIWRKLSEVLKKIDKTKTIAQRKSEIFKDSLYLNNNGQVNYQYSLAFGLNGIQFDENCQIKNYEHFKNHIETHTSNEELIKLAKNGVENMAKNAQWENKTINFPLINIIRYPITEDNDHSGLPWHRDALGDTTMTVLLNPKSNNSYVGGGLRTAESYDINLQIINRFGLLEWPHKKHTEQLHPYEQNSGFLFTNCKHFLHQAQEAKIQPSNTTQTVVEKRLFSIFADSNKLTPPSIASALSV